MKKSLLALAVLGAFAGAASAQTSVTIYGSFDGGIRDTTNVNAAGDSRWTMGSNGTYNSNRLGFKGVEDLGGGLNAHFTLESGFNTGTGALDTAAGTLFNRSAFVGLGGAWGAVDLGRQYSVSFKTIGAYDPFNYKYTGIIPLAGVGGLTRLNNDVQYTGTFGGVTARAEYALGERAGSTSDASTKAIGVSYAGGPFSVGGAYTNRSNNLGTTAVPFFQDQKSFTVGGAFKAAAFRVAVGYAKDKQETGTVLGDATVKNAWVGGDFMVSPAVDLTAAFYQTKADLAGIEGKRSLTVIGATYALSKRTNFYADFDHSKLTDAMIPASGQDTNNGFSVGINHLF